MERKILIEVTEKEYEKIKAGALIKEPETIVEIKETPIIKDIKFKFNEDDNVSFEEINCSGEKLKVKGTVVGFALVHRLPSNMEKYLSNFNPMYLVEYVSPLSLNKEEKWTQWLDESQMTYLPKKKEK